MRNQIPFSICLIFLQQPASSETDTVSSEAQLRIEVPPVPEISGVTVSTFEKCQNVRESGVGSRQACRKSL